MVHVARRSHYNANRASFGPEWEALALRCGHAPFYDFEPDSFVKKLANSSMYGKMAFSRR